jgi:hypothetical protein
MRAMFLASIVVMIAGLFAAKPAIAQAQPIDVQLVGCTHAYAYLSDGKGPQFDSMFNRFAAAKGLAAHDASVEIAAGLERLIKTVVNNGFGGADPFVDVIATCQSQFGAGDPRPTRAPPMPAGMKLPVQLADKGRDVAKQCAAIYHYYAFGPTPAFDDMVAIMRNIDPRLSGTSADALAMRESKSMEAREGQELLGLYEAKGLLSSCTEYFGALPPPPASIDNEQDANAKRTDRLTISEGHGSEIYNLLAIAKHYQGMAVAAAPGIPSSTYPAGHCIAIYRVRLLSIESANAWAAAMSEIEKDPNPNEVDYGVIQSAWRQAQDSVELSAPKVSSCFERGYLQ